MSVATSTPADFGASGIAVDAEHRGLGSVRLPGQILVRAVPHGPRILVVADDMPFLVDALLLRLQRLGIEAARVVHPRVPVRRDAAGHLCTDRKGVGVAESWIALHLERRERCALVHLRAIEAAITDAVAGVAEIVRAGPGVVAELGRLARGAHTDDEVTQFLAWASMGNLTMLSHRVEPVGETLGSIRFERGTHSPVLRESRSLVVMVAEPGTTTWHRFEAVVGRAASRADVTSIPIVRRRVTELLGRIGARPDSWSGRRALDVLQNVPLAELLRADPELLARVLRSVPEITDQKRVRLFLDADARDGTVSALVFLPRDSCTREARSVIRRVLEEAVGGPGTENTALMAESHVALVAMSIDTPSERAVLDENALEEQLAQVLDTWGAQLVGMAGPGARGAVFPPAYRADVGPVAAAHDLSLLDALAADGGITTVLNGDHFRMFVAGRWPTLSAALPVLASLGLDVVDDQPYEVRRSDGLGCWIHDFAVRLPVPDGADADLQQRVADTFVAVWDGRCEPDRLNGLVLTAGLTWRQVGVVRALVRYLHQLGSPDGCADVTGALCAHPRAVGLIVSLFEAQFDRADLDPADPATVGGLVVKRPPARTGDHDVDRAAQRAESTAGAFSYVSRLADDTGASSADVVRAFHVATAVFGLGELTDRIAKLATTLPHNVTDRLALDVHRLLDRASRWFLTRRPQPLDVSAEIELFGPALDALTPHVNRFVRGAEADELTVRVRDHRGLGVPTELAERCAAVLYSVPLLDIVEITGHPDRTGAIAGLYFTLADRLDLHDLATFAATIPSSAP